MQFLPLPLFVLALVSYIALPSLADTCVVVPADYVARIKPTSSMSYLSITSIDKHREFTSANTHQGWSVGTATSGDPGQPETPIPNYVEVSNRGVDMPTEWGLFRFVFADYIVSKWYWLEKLHGCNFNSLDYGKILDVHVASSSIPPPGI